MAEPPPAPLRTRCVIAGGGPAGVMLGYLLARAGVPVVILEKHRDFFRDFRGDTVHPSTLEVMAELGLLDRFLKRPHQELRRVGAEVDGQQLVAADFTRLPTRCRFIAFMPQWDFLDFLAEEARRFPAFRLIMEAEVEDLIVEAGVVRGLRARTPSGPLEVRADLVVGADGRHSAVRDRAGLPVRELGAPIDALWLRLSKRPGDPAPTLGRIARGRLLVTIDRGDYWQCAFIIRKGDFERRRAEGVEALRRDVAIAAPFLADRVGEIADWDAVKLLTVRIDRLERWSRPGLLCIGDAAHAMSPVGGVGINLAIQDAVATANLLARPLREGAPSPQELSQVQARRQRPTRVIQDFQVFVQDRILSRILGRDAPVRLPWPVRALTALPLARRMAAGFIGIGPRPEHVGRELARLFRAAPEHGPA